ncbi:PREDICTED: homocysteine S-methyltransferase 3-like [Dinoponera quadriceps]|uniref:Homocysteine S-methyltransferase 3-like n=1 Tax=Dinoponera quadriceps TaxID=609295 RepID=A0A6P3WXV2_DINQU|nr:PREDICTED: homocysteine S-methyltransferase 3-like [Dinoponera quadriceps]
MDKLLVVDGDFKAELRRHFPRAEDFGRAFPLHALIEDRRAVMKTHLAYLRAGAQIIRTNTYYATKDAFEKHLKLTSPFDYTEYLHGAVNLAKHAVKIYGEETGEDMNSEEYKSRRPLIAGCCSSVMASLYDDEIKKFYICDEEVIDDNLMYSPDYLLFFHSWRVYDLLQAGVDILSFEAIPTFREAIAILNVLRYYKTRARAWISLLCPEDAKIVSRVDFPVVAAHCFKTLPKQIIAVGAECDSPGTMIPAIRSLNGCLKDKPCMLYTSKYVAPGKGNIGASSSSATLQHGYVHEWWDAGVRYIGGGPDTVAEDIQQIREQVDYFYQSTDKSFLSRNPCSYRNKKNLSKL